MDKPSLEVVAQAYMTYQSAVLLLKISSTRNEQRHLWRPIGGKTIKEKQLPHGQTRHIVHPQGLLRPQISSYQAPYVLFSVDGTLLYDYDIQTSPNSSHMDITLIHYGSFKERPRIDAERVQLFSTADLEQLKRQGTLEEYVYRWSQRAFRLAEMYQLS